MWLRKQQESPRLHAGYCVVLGVLMIRTDPVYRCGPAASPPLPAQDRGAAMLVTCRFCLIPRLQWQVQRFSFSTFRSGCCRLFFQKIESSFSGSWISSFLLLYLNFPPHGVANAAIHCLFWGATTSSAQGLVLLLCSRIVPGGAPGPAADC